MTEMSPVSFANKLPEWVTDKSYTFIGRVQRVSNIGMITTTSDRGYFETLCPNLTTTR